METVKQREEQISYLDERLDNIESELNALNHKRYELEDRRKYLLKKMEELTEIKIEKVFDKLEERVE
jgi:prefoldin subunit 5